MSLYWAKSYLRVGRAVFYPILFPHHTLCSHGRITSNRLILTWQDCKMIYSRLIQANITSLSVFSRANFFGGGFYQPFAFSRLLRLSLRKSDLKSARSRLNFTRRSEE